MANVYRGQTPFRALGREMFVTYRTQEIAAMQAALGLCRPDPLATPITEEVPALNLKKEKDGRTVHVTDEDGRMLAALDENGKPMMRVVIVNAHELQRRKVAAFDAAFQNPTVEDLVVFIRCGLGPWERDNAKLSKAEFDALTEELGYLGLRQLHEEAIVNSYKVALPAADEAATKRDDEDDDPNSESPAPASQT